MNIYLFLSYRKWRHHRRGGFRHSSSSARPVHYRCSRVLLLLFQEATELEKVEDFILSTPGKEAKKE
jgi:hypothetical protein